MIYKNDFGNKQLFHFAKRNIKINLWLIIVVPWNFWEISHDFGNALQNKF